MSLGLELGVGIGAGGFSPRRVPGLGLWLDMRVGVETTSLPFAGTGTVTVVAGAATFTTAQDGALAVNETVTINGNPYTATARASGTSWTLAPANSEGAGSAFTITKAAPRVTAWRDQSGNVRDWTKATATNQPLLAATGVTFDGIDDRLDGVAAALSLAQNVPGLTVVLVKSVTTLGTAPGILQLRIGTGATSRVSVAKASNDKWNYQAVRLDTDGLASLAQGAVMTGAPDVSTHLLDYGSTTAARWINGSQDVTNAAYLTAGLSSNTASTAAFLGSVGGSGFFGGNIRAVLVYQRALSTTERQYVERGLGLLYGVTVA